MSVTHASVHGALRAFEEDNSLGLRLARGKEEEHVLAVLHRLLFLQSQ